MTNPTPTPQAPPQELTDKQLLELMPQQFQEDLTTVSRLAAYGTPAEPGFYRVVLNTGALTFARAAIAAHEAARPQLTPEEVEARFRAWWAESFPNAPAGPHAVRSHVAFALHLLGGEVAA